jgi:hypothetical protein
LALAFTLDQHLQGNRGVIQKGEERAGHAGIEAKVPALASAQHAFRRVGHLRDLVDLQRPRVAFEGVQVAQHPGKEGSPLLVGSSLERQ